MAQLGSVSADPSGLAKNILLVDDDKEVLETVNSLLSEKGYAVETAETGKDAIEKSKQKKFDVAIIDITLPDMEGTKLLPSLGGESGMRKIMITGSSSLSNAIDSLNFGAHAYLMKPVEAGFLLKVVEEQLQKQLGQNSATIDIISQFIQERESDFVSVVKQSLHTVLGEPTTQTTIFHLGGEKTLNDPRKFAENLKTLFDAGAETILKDILKKLESSRPAKEGS